MSDRAVEEALNRAITAAQVVDNDPTATTEQIADAKSALDDAKAAFDAAKKTAKSNKGSLSNALDAAAAAEEGIATSKDGSGLANGTKYTTPAEKKALDDAIAAAKKVANNPNATQKQIDEAQANLDAATKAYKKAIKTAKAEWTRLAGDTRIGTMYSIVKEGFASSDTAIVATAWNFPDALGASALAGVYGCPVITTDVDSLTPEARNQLVRLNVKNVIVLGGTAAVSTNTVKQIKAIPTVTSVKRLSGDTRYDTSLAVYKQFQSKKKSGYDTLIITTGAEFADSLSISPYAYAKGIPMLLADPSTGLTADMVKAVKADKNVKKVVIVTTGSAVNVSKIKSQLSGKSFTTIKGSTVYDTNKAVVDFELKSGMTTDKPVVATGENYADALTGAPLAGKNNSVMVLVKDANSAGVSVLAANKTKIKHGYFLGGIAAIPDAVCTAIAKKTDMKFVK